jgi:branched-chain amino acid transport system permease protein
VGTILVIGIATGAVYGLFAFGLVLVYKATRVLNFAQAEIGAFAAFLTWTFTNPVHLPWALAAGIALAASGVVGVVFERLVIRPLISASRMTLVVATVSAGLLVGGIELKAWGGNPKVLASPFTFRGPSIAGVVLPPPRLVALVIGIVAAAAAAWFFRRTTFGLALLAAAQDVVGVRLTGIRLRHLSAFTWGVSSIIGGVTGIVIALSLGAFAPFFMARLMLLAFAAAVVGGMTSLPGALVGGVLVGVAEATIAHFWISVPGLVETVMFGVIVLVLLVRPSGLLGRAA